MGVTENDTNLRGGGALPGELGDLLDDLVGGGLEPGGSGAGVGESGGRNALALAVKSTHLVESEVVAATVVMLFAVRVRRGRRFVVKFSRGSRFVWSGKFFAYLGQTSRLCGISLCLCGPTSIAAFNTCQSRALWTLMKNTWDNASLHFLLPKILPARPTAALLCSANDLWPRTIGILANQVSYHFPSCGKTACTLSPPSTLVMIQPFFYSGTSYVRVYNSLIKFHF